MANHKGMEKATFAAGCFWSVEAGFRKIPGVISTTVGYTGGTHDNPSYEDVCSGRTGHAEVVQVTFDPAQISYGDLLDVFWECHDPTYAQPPGPGCGYPVPLRYIFHDAAQEQAARASLEMAQSSGSFASHIVTEITSAATFHMAEDYHQQYLEKRGMASCH